MKWKTVIFFPGGIFEMKSQINTICILAAHYSSIKMGARTSQTTGVSIVYCTVCSGVDQRKLQSSASLAFVREIHRWRVNSPHKGTVTRKILLFDDVIMDSVSRPRQNVYQSIYIVYVYSRCPCIYLNIYKITSNEYNKDNISLKPQLWCANAILNFVS